MADMTIGEILAWLLAIDVVLYTAVGILRYLTWRATCDILRVVRQGYVDARMAEDRQPVMLKADGDIDQATADRLRARGGVGVQRGGVHRAVPEDECPRCVRGDDGEIHDVSGFDEMPCRHVE